MEGFFYSIIKLFPNFHVLKKPKTYILSEVISRMESYCAYQERCHKEVIRKLQDLGVTKEATNHVIHHLLQQDFLNEARFSQSFARGKFRVKKWGRIRISNELKMRDISKYNIQLALKEITDSDYQNTFHEIAVSKCDQLKNEKDVQKKRRKLADYLLYRGWESSLVYDKVMQLIP